MNKFWHWNSIKFHPEKKSSTILTSCTLDVLFCWMWRPECVCQPTSCAVVEKWRMFCWKGNTYSFVFFFSRVTAFNKFHILWILLETFFQISTYIFEIQSDFWKECQLQIPIWNLIPKVAFFVDVAAINVACVWQFIYTNTSEPFTLIRTDSDVFVQCPTTNFDDDEILVQCNWFLVQCNWFICSLDLFGYDRMEQ